MLSNYEVVDKILKSEDPQPFAKDDYAAVFVRLIGFYEEHSSADYQRFLEIIEDPALRKIAMEAALVERDPEHAEAEIADCLKQLKNIKLKCKLKNYFMNPKKRKNCTSIDALLKSQCKLFN